MCVWYELNRNLCKHSHVQFYSEPRHSADRGGWRMITCAVFDVDPQYVVRGLTCRLGGRQILSGGTPADRICGRLF